VSITIYPEVVFHSPGLLQRNSYLPLLSLLKQNRPSTPVMQALSLCCPKSFPSRSRRVFASCVSVGFTLEPKSPQRERLHVRGPFGASTGLADGDVEVTFPLTKKYALFASLDNALPLYVNATPETISKISYRTCRTASRLIASSKEVLEDIHQKAVQRRVKLDSKESFKPGT